jgi:hypothetical protein
MTNELTELIVINNDINEKYTSFNPLVEYVNVTIEKDVVEYTKKISYNEYEFIDKLGNTRKCFKKFISLVDYVKFLIGKYKNEEINVLPSNETVEESNFRKCIQCPHNYAYVDGFFYYVTSKLKKNGFIHGIELYDSFICIKNNFEIDIADDFEYIGDSNFFNEKLNHLFYFKDEKISTMFKKDSKLDPIHITNEDVDLVIEDLYKENDTSEIKEYVSNVALELSDITIDNIDSDIDDSETISNSDDSIIDNSDDEVEEPEEWSTDSESFHDSEEELEKLIIVINEIPTHVISIEKCENTFDSLLDTNDIKIEELESAMFQIIVILYTYQSLFKFTHNDLHTNNIMFVYTDQEFIHYKIKNQVFKIPTFGRLFKIIDFGRAIYTINNKIICSDSFSENGMAHTQYNFEPFYNPNKPIIEPNYSFDLCRLACSMLDFIIDDIDDLDKFKKIPIYNMIISWIYDDNGINILYKRNGEERYPDFKLYKMISRIVHNHIPEKQFEHVCFKKYIHTEYSEITIDLDELIKNPVHL